MLRPKSGQTLRQYIKKYQARKRMMQSDRLTSKSRLSLRSKSHFEARNSQFTKALNKLRQQIYEMITEEEVRMIIFEKLDQLVKVYEREMNSHEIQKNIFEQIQTNSQTTKSEKVKAKLRKKKTMSEHFDINILKQENEEHSAIYSFTPKNNNQVKN